MTTTAPRRIVLIGMMGVGKSTVGKKLAGTLGFAFVDLDTEVEHRAQCRIPEIFEREGEAGFRAREGDALQTVFRDAQPLVVATGGGIVEGPAAALLEGETCVWLDASTETLIARVGSGSGRPMLAGDVAETLTTLAERRRAKYLDLATVRIAVDAKTVAAVVAEVLNSLEAPC